MKSLHETLAEYGRELLFQDNLATKEPIFMVQRRHRIYGVETSDERAWISDDSGREATEEEARTLDAKGEARVVDGRWHRAELVDGFVKLGYIDTWENVQPFFTRKGAEEYILRNSHNLLPEARVYVESAHRNPEWQNVRTLLLYYAEGKIREEEDRDVRQERADELHELLRRALRMFLGETVDAAVAADGTEKGTAHGAHWCAGRHAVNDHLPSVLCSACTAGSVDLVGDPESIAAMKASIASIIQNGKDAIVDRENSDRKRQQTYDRLCEFAKSIQEALGGHYRIGEAPAAAIKGLVRHAYDAVGARDAAVSRCKHLERQLDRANLELSDERIARQTAEGKAHDERRRADALWDRMILKTCWSCCASLVGNRDPDGCCASCGASGELEGAFEAMKVEIMQLEQEVQLWRSRAEGKNQ